MVGYVRVWLILVFAVILTGARSIAAQTGAIGGVVTDAQTGSPISGAQVAVLGTSVAIRGSLSNDAGAYRLVGLDAGVYTVAVTRLGYERREFQSVNVTAGETTNLPIGMSVAVFELDRVIITESRGQEQKALDAPASVAVVNLRDIEERPTLTAQEQLKALPGVDVATTGIVSGAAVARGFNNVFSGALLTLTDNRYAAVPSLRVNTAFLIPTVNEDISRIEVLLGPASALYGPNSANGVMHIISKAPFESKGTTLSIAGGERSIVRGALRHAGTFGERFGYKLSGQIMRGEDWNFTDPVEEQARADAIEAGANPDTLKIGRRDFDVDRVTGEARIDYKFSDNADVILSTGLARAGSALEMTGIGTAQSIDWQYNFYQARARWNRLFVQGFLNTSNSGDTYILRTGQPIRDKSRVSVGQAQHGFDIGKRQSFIYGIDLQRTDPRTDSTINGRNEQDDDINEVGGYLHSETKLSRFFDIFLSARVDDHSRIEDPVFSPRAAIVFKPIENQNFRLTYNRAFSTPTTNNLFLDLEVQRLDARLPYFVRAVGVPENGFRFRRDCGGGLCVRSPFVPDPSAFLPNDIAVFFPVLKGLLFAQGVDIRAVPNPTSAQVGMVLGRLNSATGRFDRITAADVEDIDRLRPTISNVYELGYKGIIGKRLLLAADVYREKREDFVGPLIVESPNAFVDSASLATYLAAVFQGGGAPAPVAQAQARGIANAVKGIPLATVTPDSRLTNSPNLLVTYRNFGELDLWGADMAAEAIVTDRFALSGTYSWVSDDFFDSDEGGGAFGVALNAPKSKGSIGARFRDDGSGFSAETRGRFQKGFPMNSGVFIGQVESYSLVDVSASYRLPFTPGLQISLNVQNIFDDKHIEFIGAPELGRLAIMQAQYTFDFLSPRK
ncbi:MAG: TonB-dependent receptor [Anaerolineae bacterium]|nr:TonB-dependent receptor [Gemmatimonadaceae bacterium]